MHLSHEVTEQISIYLTSACCDALVGWLLWVLVIEYIFVVSTSAIQLSYRNTI